MGIPDNYTLVEGCSHTSRYQAIGNSWAVPVIRWIGQKIIETLNETNANQVEDWKTYFSPTKNNVGSSLFLLGEVSQLKQSLYLNTSNIPNKPIMGSLYDIVEENNILEKFYLSPKASAGILRRKEEKNFKMNSELEMLLSINVALKTA